MSLFEKTVWVLFYFILASCIFVELATAEVDGNSALHFGGSALIGFLVSVPAQNIERPWLRRTVTGAACMVPGVIKEATDVKWSWADIGFDLGGCGTGIAGFEGLNMYISGSSIGISGTW